jgi:hypothetical protein
MRDIMTGMGSAHCATTVVAYVTVIKTVVPVIVTSTVSLIMGYVSAWRVIMMWEFNNASPAM